VQRESAGNIPYAGIIAALSGDNGSTHSIAELCETYPNAPVIGCTLRQQEMIGIKEGADDVLIKPVSRDDLRRVLGRLGRGPHTILVADDNPEMLRLLSRMLRALSRRYHVVTALDGQEALDILHRQQIDLVLLDLVMPVMDGYAVLSEMKAAPGGYPREHPDWRDIPVVVVTAQGERGEKVAVDELTITRCGGIGSADVIRWIRATLDASGIQRVPLGSEAALKS
jgi:CheY-like chemotaxis protein